MTTTTTQNKQRRGDTWYSELHGHTVRLLDRIDSTHWEVGSTDDLSPLPDWVHVSQLTQPWK